MQPAPKPKRTYEDPKLGKQCQRRLVFLRNRRDQWLPHWRLLSDYILPRRGQFLVVPNQAKGGKQNSRILDITATLAFRTLTAGMLTGVTSPARPWFKLSIDDADVADQADVKQWLAEVTRRMHVIFAKSNFYEHIETFYEDLGVFGTALLIVEDDFDDVLRFRALSIGEYMIAENAKGRVDTLYREFNMTVDNLVREFGRENCSDTVQRLYDEGTLDTEVAVVHAIEPNDEQVVGAVGAKGMPFRSVYWEAGRNEGCFLRVAGFKHFRALCGRWHVNGTDVYGRSPGMEALPDVQQLQNEQKRKAQGIDKMVNPPMVGPPELKNQQASVLPGALTTLADPTGNAFRPAYQVAPQIGELKEDIAEGQERIKEAAYVPVFMAISQMEGVQPRNEMEIGERKEEKMLALGPVLNRLDNELLGPLIEIAYERMFRTRLVPPPPPALHGQQLNVEYVSTLMQAQKAVATSAIERVAGFVGSFEAVKPDAIDKIDVDAAIDEYADLLNLPPHLIVPQDKVDQLRQQRAQQQQAQAATENGLALAQGAKTLSDTQVGAGRNALQQMLGAA